MPALGLVLATVTDEILAKSRLSRWLGFSMYEVLNNSLQVSLPLAVVGYGIYRYFTWLSVSQHSITIAFVGALLVKTFLIPLIKGIVTGALFKFFMRWLRGDKPKPRGA
jgi:hypothetical protein